MSAANDDDPLAMIRSLRVKFRDLTQGDVDHHLWQIEQSFQRRLSVAQASARTGEKRSTIYQAIYRRHLPATYEGPSNSPLVTRDDLQAWQDSPRRRARRAA